MRGRGLHVMRRGEAGVLGFQPAWMQYGCGWRLQYTISKMWLWRRSREAYGVQVGYGVELTTFVLSCDYYLL